MAKRTVEKNRQAPLIILLSVVAVAATFFLYTSPQRAQVGVAKEDKAAAADAITALQSQMGEYANGAVLQSASSRLLAADRYMPHFTDEAVDPLARVKLDTLPKLKRALEQSGLRDVTISDAQIVAAAADAPPLLVGVTVKISLTGSANQMTKAVEALINQGVPVTVIDDSLAVAQIAGANSNLTGVAISPDALYSHTLTFGIWFTKSPVVNLSPNASTSSTSSPATTP